MHPMWAIVRKFPTGEIVAFRRHSHNGSAAVKLARRECLPCQPLQCGPDRSRDRGRLLTVAEDEDMNEIPRRGRCLVASTKQTDLEAHAGGAEPADAQAGIDYVGKAKRIVIAAVSLGGDVEHWPFMDVEAARSDEVLVNRSVEILIVAGVVDMPPEVVVAPARRNRQKVRIVLAPFVGSFGHGKIFREGLSE